MRVRVGDDVEQRRLTRLHRRREGGTQRLRSVDSHAGAAAGARDCGMIHRLELAGVGVAAEHRRPAVLPVAEI